MGFFNRLKSKFSKNEEVSETYSSGMEKSRQSFTSKFNDLITRYRQVDEDFFDELEETLIMEDVSVTTAMDLIETLKMEVKRKNIKDPNKINEVICEKVVALYYGEDDESIDQLKLQTDELSIILVVGVNG